jgi:hypothetical protein
MYRERAALVEYTNVRNLAVHHIACHRKCINYKCTLLKVQRLVPHHDMGNFGIGESDSR